ncbi:unnamed protein product [Phytophthora lilii]|uniref:Unnamed protein product n=1 Tax=Phytophthora lilii TaxID=2077276 RepID=A0A9W6U5T8_9STRA|nr:unnamed protein product [Phytophthora lilii]
MTPEANTTIGTSNLAAIFAVDRLIHVWHWYGSYGFTQTVETPPGTVRTSSASAPVTSTTVPTGSVGVVGSPVCGDVVPTVEIATSPVDYATVLTSLEHLRLTIDRNTELERLRAEHTDLQRAYTANLRCVAEAEQQSEDAAQAASPFVQFCQQKHDLVRHQLETARAESAQYQSAFSSV